MTERTPLPESAALLMVSTTRQGHREARDAYRKAATEFEYTPSAHRWAVLADRMLKLQSAYHLMRKAEDEHDRVFAPNPD